MSSLSRVAAKRLLRKCLVDGIAAANVTLAAEGLTALGLQLDNESTTPSIPYVRGTIRHTGADNQESTAWEQGEQVNRFERSGIYVLNVYSKPDEPGTEQHDRYVDLVKGIFEGKASTAEGMRFIRCPANEIGVIPGTGAYTTTVNVFFEYFENK